MGNGLENGRQFACGVLFKIVFFILLVLLGALVLVKTLDCLEDLVACLALPLCLSRQAHIRLLQQNPLLLK